MHSLELPGPVRICSNEEVVVGGVGGRKVGTLKRGRK